MADDGSVFLVHGLLVVQNLPSHPAFADRLEQRPNGGEPTNPTSLQVGRDVSPKAIAVESRGALERDMIGL